MAVKDGIGPGSKTQALLDGKVMIDVEESTPAPLPWAIAVALRRARRARWCRGAKPEMNLPLQFGLLLQCGLLLAGILCCMMVPLPAASAVATPAASAVAAIVGDTAGAQALAQQQTQASGAAPAQQALQSGAAQAQSTSTAVGTTPSNKQIALAETLLFQTNHLRNVPPASILMYAFHKTGSVEPGFDDQVKLVVNAGHGAGHAVTMLFLSGPRQRQSPEVEDPEGNPVLLGFLERDIAEMHRLTGGSTNYFRKRIRLALADAAQVRPYRFTYGGAPTEGREVVVEPYRNDPMHERFEAYTQKRYVFIISEQVPGGVYQVRATVPAAARSAAPPSKPGPPVKAERAPAATARDTAGATTASKPVLATPPLVDETLTLVGVEHGKR